MTTTDFEKIEVKLGPPYSMNNYVEPLYRGLQCNILHNIQNFILDKGSMYVRKGLERQDATALVTGEPVLSLHRAIYLSGDIHMYASIQNTLQYFSGSAWLDLTMPGDVTLTSGQRGEFRTFKNKTYYSNHTEPVLMIREGSPPTVTKAGLPSPNLKKDIDLCEDATDWTYSNGGGGGELVDDSGMARFTQGDQGVSLSQTTSGSTATITRNLASTLDLTTFEDGSAAGTEDYIAFTAFRFWKQSISQFAIAFSTGDTAFTNTFWCNVYIEPTGGVASWDYWSPRQQSMSALWANDPNDFRLFDIKLRKRWFIETGSPDWSDVRAVRLYVKGDNGASSATPGRVTVDHIRLLSSPPIAAPYRLQIAEFERDESWTGGTWVEYWATFGVSCKYMAAGQTITWDVSKDLSEYADGVSVSDQDVMSIDVGGEGSSSALITVTFRDTSLNISTFVFGVLTYLAGGGVTRQRKLANLTAYSGVDWANINRITITNASAVGVYVDNLRIERAQVQKMIDPFMPADRIFIDALGEWLDPWLRDHPLAAVLLGATAEWYEQYWYTTSGEGALTYPDYSRGEFGNCSMRLSAYAGNSFGVRIKRKFNLDLTEYDVWSASGSWTAPTRANYEAGNWGWLTKEEIDVSDEDEFQVWMSAKNWYAIRSITIRFFWDNLGGAITRTKTDNSITDSDYWEYTMDYTSIQEIVTKVEYVKAINKKFDETKWYRENPDSPQTIYNRMYLQEMGADINTDNLTYIGPEGSKIYGVENEYKGIYVDPTTGKLKQRPEDDDWVAMFLRFRMKDLMDHTTNVSANMQNIGGYEIILNAGGANAEVCFDRWILRKKGALNGRYYYRTVFEDEEGYYSAPSDISRPIDCNESDSIVTNVVTTTDTRIKNKVQLRLGGKHPDAWMKIRDLEPDTTQFVDDIHDDDALPFDQEFFYEPPKAKVIEPVGNYMWFLNVTDRFGRRKPSRGYRSRPFAPFQVGDYDVFDIRPEDGEEITGCKPFMGLLCIPKDHSIWTLDPSLSEAAMMRTEDVGIIAPRTFSVSSYGIIGLSHKGVIRGDVTKWDTSFGRPIYGAMADIDTASMANAVGFVRDDHYYIFFGDSTNNTGFACYLPGGQWSRLAGIECQAVQLLEGSGDLPDGTAENNRIWYGDGSGFSNFMLSGDDDFGVDISSEFRSMNFITDSIDRSQMLRRVAMLVKQLAVVTGVSGSGAVIGEAVIGTAVIGGGTASPTTAPTTIVTPFEGEVASTSLASAAVDTQTFRLIEQNFPQGEEGYILGIRVAGTGRFSISDVMLEIWKRPVRR